MKAVKIKKNGGPEVLELENITLKKPANDEVLIEHVAIGLNYIDTYHRSGLYPLMLPCGLGMEASGIIKEVGPNVSEFSVGDKIAYASVPLGAYSSHRLFKTKSLVKVPNEVDLTLAATLMTKGLTTNYLLCKTYKLKAGETVLFHAAAGGVGQIFAQWANSIGAKVIGTVGSDEKISVAKENGYAHVINYSKDDFAKEVLKFTNNEGVPAVFDGVGKNTFRKSLECLKTRGMMISFGNASGPLDPINVPKDIQPKGLYLTRPSIAQYFTNQKELQDGADAVFEKVKFGKIKIRVSKEYRLADVKRAHEDLESRKLTGPAVIIP